MITMRLNGDEEDKKLWRSQIGLEEGICWFARTVWENLLYTSYLSTSGTRVQYKWITHAATLCTRAGQATGQQAIKWTDDDKK